MAGLRRKAFRSPTTASSDRPGFLAKFDVWRLRGSNVLVLECQADLLNALATRLVAPLLEEADVPKPLPRLHPSFTIEGQQVVMATHLAASIPVGELGRHVVSLIDRQDAINNALDMLVTGF